MTHEAPGALRRRTRNLQLEDLARNQRLRGTDGAY